MASVAEYCANHVFLPPKLPQTDDYSFQNEYTLTKNCQESLKVFQGLLPFEHQQRLNAATKMFDILLLSTEAELPAARLDQKLSAMSKGDSTALHLPAQNAGLIVRRTSADYVFESFELSATNSEIMGTTGRLVRSFPSVAMCLPEARGNDPGFRAALIQTLGGLYHTTPQEANSTNKKAGSVVVEIRDTIHPKFVTEWLFGVLRGFGIPREAPPLHKRTRDEVLWSDCLTPWRRSPRWLLLRVSLQSYFLEVGHLNAIYKLFMIYFMARLLKLGLASRLPHQLLFVMLAKITRRIQKLGGPFFNNNLWAAKVQKSVRDAMQETQKVLADAWSSATESSALDINKQPEEVSRLVPRNDINLRLTRLQDHISLLRANATASESLRKFEPAEVIRLRGSAFMLPSFNTTPSGWDSRTRLYLMDVEQWTRDFLDEWLELNTTNDLQMAGLSELIEWYLPKAMTCYANSPEDTSVMILTVMSLWVALDKGALACYSFLSDYDTQISPNAFVPLLLPRRDQMERILAIEGYLTSRQNNVTIKSASIFEFGAHNTSFGVRYFDRSQSLQALKKKIESRAQSERAEKKAEFARQRMNYTRLMAESDALSCTQISELQGRGRRRQMVQFHDRYRCTKCIKLAEAQGIYIHVHEWPLPGNDVEAKSVVFELQMPKLFSRWRTITFQIIADLLCFPKISEPQFGDKMYALQDYYGLNSHFTTSTSKLKLASRTKPFILSHYKGQLIVAATESSLCVNNGLKFQTFVGASSLLALDVVSKPSNIRHKCTFQLPPGVYNNLQYALVDTNLSSNDVISRQFAAPSGLTLHEFNAFASLRSGARLQWLNIARELLSPILNFAHGETHFLICQAAWQLESSNPRRLSRDAHFHLEEEAFGHDMLSALNGALTRVESNWQGAFAVLTFITIAARCLSINSLESIRKKCLLFLERSRKAALSWVREVVQLLLDSEDESELESLNLRILDLALICHTTFDLDETHLTAVLSSQENIAVLTECAITIHDRSPISGLPSAAITKVLLHRFARVSHRLEPFLKQRLLSTGAGIEQTLRKLWGGYRSGGDAWLEVGKPNEHWLTSRTLSSGSLTSMEVHFNVLDGALLVNGYPLARLPSVYELHETYRRIFGKRVLEVVPSNIPGMSFETRYPVHGHQIHFSFGGDELGIRACFNDDVLDLITPKVLENDLSRSFVRNYVAWYHRSTGLIELRPLVSKWVSSRDNWFIKMPDSPETANMYNETHNVVDVRSSTAALLHRLLKPLERPSNIDIIFECSTGNVEIHLPRLDLNFLLRSGTSAVESKQFRGMKIDADQQFGSFTGLVNRLILRDVSQASSRIVIVPHGNVSFHEENIGSRAFIDNKSDDKVSYHQYIIDDQLGQLLDNGTLKSRLYRLYLHAITSHCLPDRLTGRTGTEEALNGLRSAATRSFPFLTEEAREQLKLFSALTPHREFYPKGSKLMQKVRWIDLSPASQHEGFVEEITSILELGNSLRCFQGELGEAKPMESRGSSELHTRASIRNATYRVDGFGAEKFSVGYDKRHCARDRSIISSRELEVVKSVDLTDRWSCNLKPTTNLLAVMESWKSIIYGTSIKVFLGFDEGWLSSMSSFLPSVWCSLHQVLSRSDRQSDKYRIAIFISLLSYSKAADLQMIHTLIALATVLRDVRPPEFDQFDLTKGYAPDRSRLREILLKHVVNYEQTPEGNLLEVAGENVTAREDRREAACAVARDLWIKKHVDHFVNQWPTEAVTRLVASGSETYLKVQHAMPEIQSDFRHWFRNSKFREYVRSMQITLNTLSQEPRSSISGYRSIPAPGPHHYRRPFISMEDLFQGPPPNCSASQPKLDITHLKLSEEQSASQEVPKLDKLLQMLSQTSDGPYEKTYIEDLRRSYKAFQGDILPTVVSTNYPMKQILSEHLGKCRTYLSLLMEGIISHLYGLRDPMRSTAHIAGLLPRLSPGIILAFLARFAPCKISLRWKTCIVEYALAVTELQRAERMLACSGQPADLRREILNEGHSNWDPLQNPEWLLLEVESGLLIREDQAQIAAEMLHPSSGANSLMQLNMGLGKTSVITPIVAASLGDGLMLARVFALKSLSAQMFQLLVKKLSGLIGRRIVFLPISRDLELDLSAARQLQKIYEDCLKNGSILLVQPEHVLSFELLGIDHLLSGTSALARSSIPNAETKEFANITEVGRTMVNTQRWLHEKSRDVLDESDEILSVKFELTYTMGLQSDVDFGSNRWLLTERVLDMFAEKAQKLSDEYPEGLEILQGPTGSFPRIRILQELAGIELLSKLAKEICVRGVPSLSVWGLRAEDRGILYDFLTKSDIDEAQLAPLVDSGFMVESNKKGWLLLRGLFASGILLFAFSKKRWRVNYGLALSRSLLAVPYLAKDIPSARSEFSHPDSAIVLTCLSYYYGGLNDDQIILSFEKLLQSDNATGLYEDWIRGLARLPSTFRSLTGVNLRNTGQCVNELFPLLRFSKGLIDFYISTLVFPKEMKEFTHKLSSSGWELARRKALPTTGFSGTNDSRYMLPIPIQQYELPEQLGTNAEVLNCLLRPENTFCRENLDADTLIDIVLACQPPVRVILDVGAQLLEQNETISKYWLGRVPQEKAQAVVFFHEDELFVLNRDGAREPLVSSPFMKQLDQCLIYLDESHTRGTDLKMPADYRALVTLGPDLTKDRLAQACMRMRKLGLGQSVVFCASREVELKLLASSGKANRDDIEIIDILVWCIRNTWDFTRKCIPLWATQGLRFYRRHAACATESGLPDPPELLLEAESQTLQQRYGVDGNQSDERLIFHGQNSGGMPIGQDELAAIRQKCADFTLASFRGAALHEEQERELQPESEREQQTELPPKVFPCTHNLHANVLKAINQGQLSVVEGIKKAFDTFANTGATRFLERKAWPADLLVTSDFAATVKASATSRFDSFLRPVNWIVSFSEWTGDKCRVKLLVVSPFEANELLPIIKRQKFGTRNVRLHVYSPRLSQSLRTLETLNYCAIPAVPENWRTPAITTALNIFAGQVYLRNFDEYVTFCRFLGLCHKPPGPGVKVASDGFVDPAARKFLDTVMAEKCTFSRSPVEFLRMIMSYRRKGHSYESSHMGKVLYGDLLKEDRDFEDVTDLEMAASTESCSLA